MDSGDVLLVQHDFFFRVELLEAPFAAGTPDKTLQEIPFFTAGPLCDKLDDDVTASVRWAVWVDIDQIPLLIDRLHRASHCVDAIDTLSAHLSRRAAHEIDRLSRIQSDDTIRSAFGRAKDGNILGKETEVRRFRRGQSDVGWAADIIAIAAWRARCGTMAIDQPCRVDGEGTAVSLCRALRDIARAVDMGANGHLVLMREPRKLGPRADAAKLHGLAQAMRGGVLG